MSKRPSIVKQVAEVCHHVLRIGESRHKAKIEGVAEQFIFSYESLRSHEQRCITAIRSLPDEVRPRMLRDLTAAHIGAIVGGMRERGLSGAYIKNTLGSLRKLSYALNSLGWNKTLPNDLVPDSLYEGLRRSPPRGSYSSAQADQLIAHVARDPADGVAFVQIANLARASGLRFNEVARLREADLDRENGRLLVRGTNAKGGRPRTIAGDMFDEAGRVALKAAMDAIPTGRHWLWTDGPQLARRLRDALHDACEELGIEGKGLHGFRATFTDEYIERHLATGMSEREARRKVATILGHNRPSVTYRYRP